MGAIANKVLSDLGYDSGYKIGGSSTVRRNTFSNANKNGQGSNFVGNVFNSIRSGAQAAGNLGLGALKRTFVDEPLNYAKYTAGTLARPFQSLAAGDQKQLQKSLPAFTSTITNAFMPGNGVAQIGKLFNKQAREADVEYAKRAAPIIMTGLTLGAGKVGTAAVREGGGVLGSLSRGVGRIADDTIGAGKSFGSNPLMQFGGKVVRNELLTRPTAETFPQIAGQVASGDYKGAALNAALLASGGLKLKGAAGPVGAVNKLLTGASSKTGKLFVNKAGVFDLIKVKGGSVTKELTKLAKRDPERAKVVEDVLRVAQDNILTQYKGDRKAAAKLITQYMDIGGSKNLKNIDIEKFALELNDLAEANKAAQKLVSKGKTIVDAQGKTVKLDRVGQVGAIKSTQADKTALRQALKSTQSPQEAAQMLDAFLASNPRFAQNKQNQRVIQGIKEAGSFGDSAAAFADEGLKGANELFVKTKSGKLKPIQFDNGFILGERAAGSAPFREVSKTAQLEKGKAAPFGFVGGALEKVGLSPAQASEFEAKAQFNKVSDAFSENLRKLGINKSGGDVLDSLRQSAEKKWGVFDVRQLRPAEVAESLRISKDEAKQVIKAYKDAVSTLSFSERGLAGKLMDFNLNKNPLAAPYSRVQNTLKYEKNPFFSMQERIETRMGVASLGAGTRRPMADYSKQTQELENLGFFKNAGFGSEGADIGGIKGITSKLKQGQKETIAAGMENLAQKQGKSLRQFFQDPQNADLIQEFKTVVQYPDKGFTSSNLAKMLNLVTFPARYNIKITQFALKQLGKQPGIVQVGVLKGLGDYYEFLDSPEGMKWQSDNKEALGIIKYFSPTNNIAQVINILRGRARNVGDIGVLGGLPFGVITQALAGQGVLKTDSAYVDPRTGKVFDDRIPESLKGRAYQLLTDVIGSMYNYPGRQVGLDMSKKDLNEVIPKTLLGKPGNGDFKTVERTDISPEDRKLIQVLNAGKTPTPVQSTKFVPSVGRASTLQPIKVAPVYKSKKAKKGRVPSIPISRL